MFRIFTKMIRLVSINLYHFFLLSNFCDAQGKLGVKSIYLKQLQSLFEKIHFAKIRPKKKNQTNKQ